MEDHLERNMENMESRDVEMRYGNDSNYIFINVIFMTN